MCIIYNQSGKRNIYIYIYIYIYMTAASRAVPAIPTCLCGIFMCPNNGTAASVWNFDCAHRLWCLRLHIGGGCMTTVKGSATKSWPQEKNLLPHQGIKFASASHPAFHSDALSAELSGDKYSTCWLLYGRATNAMNQHTRELIGARNT